MNKQLRRLQDYFGSMYKNDDKAEIQMPNTDRKIVKVSLEADKRIIKKLEKFERKQHFLLPDMSLSNMANIFNTNTTYLSVVIKNHKNLNFNAYINNLRIDYIINKLKTSPRYLNYKISYLAKESGFGSHTVFSRIFKEKTGRTPAEFIDLVRTGGSELL
ncbi:helix-turn-helix domain-containing protein [Epilithonimonas sp. UC225_85]|uniref:helix-turn-helix domain-containing protein n=1 Tax=Epilithonimonas sp. UC225_85 TaxID=3350167 RepID=UPI0036D421B3